MTNIFVKALVERPNITTQSYPMYFVHTVGHKTGRATMNNGVCIKGANYSENARNYYGQLIEILELEYLGYPFERTVLLGTRVLFGPLRTPNGSRPMFFMIFGRHGMMDSISLSI